MATRRLSTKELIFAAEYAIHGSGIRAALAAGYSQTCAGGMATYLLAQIRVRDAITLKQQDILRERDITHGRILEEYRRLAFADARSLHRPDGSLKGPAEWDDETASQIAGIEVARTRTTALGSGTDGAAVQVEEQTVKVKRHDKIKALDRLAEITGLLGSGTASGSRAGGTGTGSGSTPVDQQTLSQMSDTELATAIETARRLRGETPSK